MSKPFLVVAAAFCALAVAYAQAPRRDAPGDWPTYNRDLTGTRHSPLSQITPATVAFALP